MTWRSHNGETLLEIHCGDALAVLRTLPSESVHCCVTSPPYHGLRDYGTARWEGGDSECDHIEVKGTTRGGPKSTITGGQDTSPHDGRYRDACGKCGAIRIDDQLGLEPTPEAYVARLVEVFREVKRVLRPDATCWVVIGDSYASGKGTCFNPGGGENSLGKERKAVGAHPLDRGNKSTLEASGLKPKDLVGIPWLVAFALRADGWWLRSDIIWAKPNPMPESVTDRPTKAHEYIFLLAKSERYYYDAEAVKEASVDPESYTGQKPRNRDCGRSDIDPTKHATKLGLVNPVGKKYPTRNLRSVWTIATQPYAEAHFAVFPPALVEPCIKAGTSERGCCPVCGAPWVRVMEKQPATMNIRVRDAKKEILAQKSVFGGKASATNAEVAAYGPEDMGQRRTVDWQPTCTCDQPPQPCTVLDPFLGSGTTLLVAQRLGRNGTGIDLSAEYVKLAQRRIDREHRQLRLPLEGMR